MTPTMQKFLELEAKKSEIKKYFEDLKEATEALVKEIGVGSYFQAPDGTVFQAVIPEGRFVAFDKVGYIRTRRPDEKRGDLSMKDAEAAGFNVDHIKGK